jgi:predicted Zn-dependent peptidase
MDYKTLEYEFIDEKMHVYEHPSGLKTYVIQKKGYHKAHAAFAANYGSIDNNFIIPGEKDITNVPDGIAHFLEHKLFEQEDGSIMNKFSELGSNPNAYTGFTKTVYHFNCTDKFLDNFELLIDFVQNPYITEKSVEKEKGIIEQEILMYEDSPGWRSFFNLLGSMYHNHPVKNNIAGSIESIAEINRDVLYTCYNTFYHPSNMVICVTGDVTPETVFEAVDKGIKKYDGRRKIKRIFPDEPENIKERYVEQKLAVSTPLFQIGFKDNTGELEGIESARREIAVNILLSMLIGRSSDLYEQLYNKGLVNGYISYDYNIERDYGFSILGSESNNPEKVRDIIAESIEKILLKGIDEKIYERIRKAFKGRFIRGLNSVEKISDEFISVYFKNINLFDYLYTYDKINFEYINSVFKEHFNLERLSLSVIKPV